MRPWTYLAAIEGEITTVVEVRAKIARMTVTYESSTNVVDNTKRLDVEVQIETLVSVVGNGDSHARDLESPNSPQTVRRVLRRRRRRIRTRPKWHPTGGRAARLQRSQGPRHSAQRGSIT